MSGAICVCYRGALDTQGMEAEAEEQPLRTCPSWLGNFDFRMYGLDPETAKARKLSMLPPLLAERAAAMATLLPDQRFNIAFLQRYETWNQVYSHKDPRNNTGYTLIGLFGTWEGATTLYGPGLRQVGAPMDGLRGIAGDVIRLPCTINGAQGPWHAVTPVISGVRWALILNTIE